MPHPSTQAKQCVVLRPGETYAGKQGLSYFNGIATQTVGSQGICMHLLTLAPGVRAKAHLHEAHETAIYVIDGETITLFGDELQYHALSRAGDLVYIPAGVPHLPVNLSSKPASAVIARTDPNEQESVVLLPHLDAAADAAIAALRASASASDRPMASQP